MTLLRADALHIPLADESVDCIVTSPPYFALRDYEDDEGSVAGQVGSEEHPYQFLDALEAWTVECLRVMKPTASLFVNLGDKRSGSGGHNNAGLSTAGSTLEGTKQQERTGGLASRRQAPNRYRQSARVGEASDVMRTGLLGLPWRYALRCVDRLGMGLVAEIIWAKRSAMPESVTRRVHGRHEHLFHLVKSPAFFAAGDEIREPHAKGTEARYAEGYGDRSAYNDQRAVVGYDLGGDWTFNPLGRMPGSFWLVDDDTNEGPVWELSAEPFRAPEGFGEHFAAFPSEIPRRCILGWTTSGYCTACGEPRRPVVDKEQHPYRTAVSSGRPKKQTANGVDRTTGYNAEGYPQTATLARITSYACACPDSDAPTRPAVVLDPFVGTGTSVMAARALGRVGIGLDLSAAYLRLAGWRIDNPDQTARVRTRTNRDAQGALL